MTATSAPAIDPNALSRSILVPFDALADTAAAQQLAIMFDMIFVWHLNRRALADEDAARVRDELAFLRTEKIAGVMAPSIPFAFGDANGRALTPAALLGADIEVPFQLALADDGPGAGLGPTDSILRNVASRVLWNYAPVSAQIETPFPAAPPQGQLLPGVMGGVGVQVLVRNFPLLPAEIPWQDVLQFRADEENQQYLRLLRLWLKQRVDSQASLQHVQEELESLLYDYRRYMALQHKKYRRGTVATVLAGVGNAIGQAAVGQFAGAVSAIAEISSQSMALSEAEFGAPGREVSYIVRAENFATEHSIP